MTPKANTLESADWLNSYEEKQQSTNLLSSDGLWSRLRRGRQARTQFVESHLTRNLAFQIRAMRDSAGWSQIELSDKVGMNQNAISRLENPGYGKTTLTTLKRLASAFDVALIVRFVPFSQLVHWVSGTPFWDRGLSSNSLSVMNFTDESAAPQNKPVELGRFPEKTLTRAREVELGSINKDILGSSKQAA